jgi:hypothetical protein
MKQTVEWRTPAPLWDLALAEGGARTRFLQPALLRFDSESFMDEIIEVLTNTPEQLSSLVARPEHWEKPAVGWAPAGDASLSAVIKLFQPAQSRFYLVAASLVCLRTGLPERKVDLAAKERVGVLMRRLVPLAGAVFDPNDATTYGEYAWIGDREKGRWELPTGADGLSKGEEVLPLFPLALTYGGIRRRLHLGMIPVAGREVYEGRAPAAISPAALENAAGGETDPLILRQDPRKAAWADGPGRALALYAETKDLKGSGDGTEMSDEDAGELLRFTLLDMVDFLKLELSALWDGIDSKSSTDLSSSAAAVYAALAAEIATGLSWREALRRADARRDVLLRDAAPPSGSQPILPEGLTRAEVADAANELLGTGDLENLLFKALDDVPSGAATLPGGAPTAAAEAAARTSADGAFYVVRCVYERPACGVFADPVVSAASRPFRLAAFFDPEAPVRPVTIRMPLDTGIRGLSRFPKGVSLVLSEKLRQQVEHLQGAKLSDIDDGKISEAATPAAWGIGMICSFSIPIITLCALIVLMIFIQLLNIVFWWLPFLRICLPIPVRKS